MFVKLAIVILVAALFTTSCRKSQAAPERGTPITNQPVYTLDSNSIGSITITEVAGGEAKVSIQVNTSMLTPFRAPFQPILENSEPLSYLDVIDPVTGISETSPVKAINRDLTVSYDLIMFTRDLQLRIVDADQKLIATAKLR